MKVPLYDNPLEYNSSKKSLINRAHFHLLTAGKRKNSQALVGLKFNQVNSL